MLYVATDAQNKNWLVYLLEEFKRINGADFNIAVIDIHEKREGNTLYYCRSFIGGPAIINKSDVLPASKTVRLSEDIFIIEGTQTDDARFTEQYDLLWNAFVFLSRSEEYTKADQNIDSYSFRHGRNDKETFEVPVVNNLFNQLESIIKRHFPDCPFSTGNEPVIELSHDVDYLQKTLQLRIRRSGAYAVNGIKEIGRPKVFLKNVISGLKFLITGSDYWCFDYWKDLEQSFDRRSTFYVYVKIRPHDIRTWFIDPSYDVRRNKKLQTVLRHLVDEGFEIGLHGSYQSAVDKDLLSKEKEILENVLNCKVTKIRQHWLRYNERVTPYLHNEIFEYDSTLGWNDRIGFRSGCASRYRPYDHRAQKGFDFLETPQIIMDGNIFNRDGSENKTEIDKAILLLKTAQGCRNAYVAISWHQRSCSNDYRWDRTYARFLESIRA